MPVKQTPGEFRTKTFSAVPVLKADDDGVVIARFATLNVIDHDGDIVRPKAIGKQLVYAGLWNHAQGVPVGSIPAHAGEPKYDENGRQVALGLSPPARGLRLKSGGVGGVPRSTPCVGFAAVA